MTRCPGKKENQSISMINNFLFRSSNILNGKGLDFYILKGLDYLLFIYVCYLCLVNAMLLRLLIAALCSPARNELTSWLLFVIFIVVLLLSHVTSWVMCGTLLRRFLIFAAFLRLMMYMLGFISSSTCPFKKHTPIWPLYTPSPIWVQISLYGSKL